jgi:effector-binding domain-containing protein
MKRSTRIALTFCMALVAFGLSPLQASAQTLAAAPDEAQKAAPQAGDPAAPAPAPDADQSQPPPGAASEASAQTLDVPARPVAYFAGDGEWSKGFKTVLAAIEKVNAAMKTAGLTAAGHPFAVFLSTDDNNFHFEAMVPLAEKPAGKTELSDSVKIKESPSGKALKFLHRGTYDDIDSTYDLITAFMDEKGLDSKNMFIEEYLTDTKEPDDSGLEADIYVFLK